MDTVSLQNYLSGASQDYQASWGQRKRAQNPAEGSGNQMPNSSALASAESPPGPPAVAEELPQLTTHGAWRLVGVVQAQALSSPPAHLAELQPVARPQLVAATYV